MSRQCALCGKKAIRANYVSHSNVKKPRRQKPNLQLITRDGQRIKVCSFCRRTIAKNANN